MLTYDLKKAAGQPLYESLCRCIRADVLSGALPAGTKLPSRRALAQNLKVSAVTVESAYAELVSEGYLRAQPRVGYFVEAVQPRAAAAAVPTPHVEPPQRVPVDLTANSTMRFPFSVWSRLQRQVMLDLGEKLLQSVPNQGVAELQRAISAHLASFRALRVAPEQILIGAGTDFLYNLIIQLLGREKCYAVEEPGYGKIRKIYAAGGVSCVSAQLDAMGVVPASLDGAQVVHLSPAHHFPTGLVTPLPRRLALLEWVAGQSDRYLIEDDYDSEFRFSSRPMPTMASLDRSGRVLYMNTFSKTLAPSIRISYLVLPRALMARFQRTLGFYGCTVASFEQYTLARFLSEGYFESHINRMRKVYRRLRDRVMAALRECPIAHALTVLEPDAGLHFLVKVDTALNDDALVETFLRAGIAVRTLGSYYHGAVPEADRRCLVVNYSALNDDALAALEQALKNVTI